jgi:hypothetical protein
MHAWRPLKGAIMENKDVLAIVEGLNLIEEGIKRIQDVMRSHHLKSLKDVAAQLLPVLEEDDALQDYIVKKFN